MNEQKTKEAKLYNAIDKLEALIQHNESPIEDMYFRYTTALRAERAFL